MKTTTTTTTTRRLLLRPISTTSSPRRQCPLAAGLAQLDSFSSDDGAGGRLPVRWCADAMRLVKRTQRDLIAAFWSSSAAEEARRFDGEGDGEEWLDLEKYMEETAALLDLCNALKSAAARLRRRCMAADFAAAAGGEDEESAEVRGSGELREAAEMLGSVVDQVFDEVIRGRNEMLGILRDKALA